MLSEIRRGEENPVGSRDLYFHWGCQRVPRSRVGKQRRVDVVCPRSRKALAVTKSSSVRACWIHRTGSPCSWRPWSSPDRRRRSGRDSAPLDVRARSQRPRRAGRRRDRPCVSGKSARDGQGRTRIAIALMGWPADGRARNAWYDGRLYRPYRKQRHRSARTTNGSVLGAVTS
jgi:hypothetical protein